MGLAEEEEGGHEGRETAAGLHEETPLREDRGLQGPGPELEDEGPDEDSECGPGVVSQRGGGPS